MASSDFWRDLAAAFRALHGFQSIGASKYVVGGQDRWEIGAGYESDFIALAMRAGAAIAGPRDSDPLKAWLRRLSQEGYFYEQSPVVETSSGEKIVGSIPAVFRSSFELCKKLEVHALRDEFEEKQRNDPRNRPPLVAQYEAFKKLKDVISGPIERIPEAVVRMTLAQVWGIKPEDVTADQVKHAIVEILPYYKSIEIVPSGSPASEPLPGPAEAGPQRPLAPKPPTVAEQLKTLKDEAHLSFEELAERIGIDGRSVRRHFGGKSVPHGRHLRAYEREFSKLFGRKVVISKMS